MKFTEKTGKTVEEAVEFALKELDVVRDKVDVEILEEPSRGIFGLIGTKPAKVRVTLIDNPELIALEFLKELLGNMGLRAQYKTKLKGDNLYVDLIGDHMGVLIGRRGQTLDSIQYLVSLVVNKNREKYIRVLIDTEDYRRKREQTLIRLAHKLATKVKRSRKDVILEPMNPYERRIIHSALQNYPEIITKSDGEEPFRKVVITHK